MSQIENCIIKYKCSQRWESLPATDHSDQRHCGVCDQTVYGCLTDRDIVRHVKAGHCIAIFSNTGDAYFMGEMSPSYHKR